MRKEFRDLASLSDAFEVLDSLDIPSAIEHCHPREARTQRLAEAINAPIDVPGFDRSVMDGYAVRADDTVGAFEDDPVELSFAGAVSAGETPTVEVGPNEAVEIATGAVMPPGADAVVMVEATSRVGDTIAVRSPVAPHDNVRFAGSDVAAGETVLRAGMRLDPRRIGLLSALGLTEVAVYRAPRVGVVSTGSEIVRPGHELEAGQIYDVNTFSLAAGIEDVGAEAVIYPHTEDDYEDIADTLWQAAADCDIVMTSGSTSASTEDVVYRVIEDEGELLLHGVAVKPGKPVVIGRLEDTPYLGLPGHPVSALMTFHLFGGRIIRRALGGVEPRSSTMTATTAEAIESVFGRTQLFPVGLVESATGDALAYDVEKGSGAVTSLTDADGYLTIDANTNFVSQDESVEVTLFGRDITPVSLLIAGEGCPVVDTAIADLESDARWLGAGSSYGVRMVRDGIADAAIVGTPQLLLDSYELSDCTLVRGYEREIGIGHTHSWSNLADCVEQVSHLAVHQRDSSLRMAVDRWIEQTSGVEPATVTRRTDAGVARLIAEGVCDAGVMRRATATANDLSFESLGFEQIDLLLSNERMAKTALEAFRDRLQTITLEDFEGYRRPERAGSVVREW